MFVLERSTFGHDEHDDGNANCIDDGSNESEEQNGAQVLKEFSFVQVHGSLINDWRKKEILEDVEVEREWVFIVEEKGHETDYNSRE